MAGILTDLKNTIIAGIGLVIISVLILMGAYGEGYSNTYEWWAFFVRWLHVLSGIMWIGILWYFNFVQIPNMPNIPDEQKPAISKVIAPAALFGSGGERSNHRDRSYPGWLNGYLVEAYALGFAGGGAKATAIGIGMWLGLSWPLMSGLLFGQIKKSHSE